MQKIELPAFYYLDNFKQLIDHVYGQYREILREEDLEFYHKFCALNRDAQALYVRFLTRKGSYFRPSKIQYAEIDDQASALEDLESHSFVKFEADVEDWVKLFNKKECCDAFPELALSKLKRGELDALIIESAPTCPDVVLQIQWDFQVFRLLYFGNNHQDLSDFVLNDLGLHEYETYPLRHGFIKSREELGEFLYFYEVLSTYDSDKPQDFVKDHEYLSSDNPVLRRRLNKFYFTVGRQLERKKELGLALELYAKTDLAGERKARVYASQQKFREMEKECLVLLESSRLDDELEFAEFFLSKNNKFLNAEYAKPKKFNPRVEALSLDKSESSVEMLARDYYSQFGDCYYSENIWANALFGLFFWEVIFADVPGAFSHPFQHRPHDLYENDFAMNRQELIDEVFEKGFFWDVIKERCREKFGLRNSFVTWALIEEELLEKILTELSQDQLKALFETFLTDLRNKRKGFPDLIFFPTDGGVGLIEIKGPGDRLQKHQNRWLEFFDKHNITARVVNVTWN